MSHNYPGSGETASHVTTGKKSLSFEKTESSPSDSSCLDERDEHKIVLPYGKSKCDPVTEEHSEPKPSTSHEKKELHRKLGKGAITTEKPSTSHNKKESKRELGEGARPKDPRELGEGARPKEILEKPIFFTAGHKEKRQERKPILRPIPERNLQDRLYNACIKGQVDVVKQIMDEHYMSWMPDEQGRTPLFAACLMNQTEVIQCLLKYGFAVSHQDNEGKTPLHVAFENNLVHMARLFNRKGADFNVRDNRGFSPLHTAVDNGFLSLSGRLLDNFLQGDVDTELNYLHLHAACYKNKVHIVKDLLWEKHVDVNHSSTEGLTPLLIACTEKNEETVKMLLDAKADVNKLSAQGNSPLLHAVYSDCSLNILQALIHHRADVNAQTHNSYTALLLACKHANLSSILELLKAGADPNIPDKEGEISLHWAAHKNCDPRIIQALLENGADINSEDHRFRTALFLACKNKHTALVSQLLKAGADPNMMSAHGLSPLHVAAFEGADPDVIKALKNHGADIEAVDKAGRTALLIACIKKKEDLIEALVTAGANCNFSDKKGDTCLHWALNEKCGVSTIQLLLQHKVMTNARNNKGYSSIYFACKSGMHVKILLEAGADPNICSIREGDTPLQKAVAQELTENVAMMLKHGANINARGSGGITALHIAIAPNTDDILKVLLSYNPEKDFCDADGDTALHLASRNGTVSKVGLLLHHGANTTCQNKAGQTPYDCARRRRDKDVIKLFEQHFESLAKRGESDKEPVLHYHCREGNADDAAKLLQEGVNVDEVYRHDTALEVALVNGHTDIVRILIDAGANVSISQSEYKFTFLERIYYQRHLHMELLEYMINTPSCVIDLTQVNADGETIFFQACKDSAVDVVSLLLSCKREDIGVNRCNASCKSPVAIACENARKLGNNSVCIVNMLMQSKRQVNVNCVDCEGKTALHRACENDSLLIANMLLTADDGCKHINFCDASGKPPVYYAQNPDLVDLLVEFGAEPNACKELSVKVAECARPVTKTKE